MSFKKQGTINWFIKSSATRNKTSIKQDKTEKEAEQKSEEKQREREADMGKGEEEETLPRGNVSISDDSDRSFVQRNLVDIDQIVSTSSRADDQLDQTCIERVPGRKDKRERVMRVVCLPNPAVVKGFCYRVDYRQFVFPMALRHQVTRFKNIYKVKPTENTSRLRVLKSFREWRNPKLLH